MMETSFILPLIWAGIIGLAVIMYVIMDGFDLGIGMLFPFTRNERERDRMMASIKPYWDGNETWLVLGGGGLLVAFPRAYAIIMPALYLPIIVMLLGLIIRGVAIEFRGLAENKAGWGTAFAAGSAVTSFAQGATLGGLIQGIKVENGAFAGSALDWATPFAVACGLGVMAGYAMLGSTWLLMKTDGKIAKRSRTQSLWLLFAVLVFMGIVSLWTPLAFPRIAERWFSTPNIYFLWPVPLATGLVALGCLLTLRGKHEVWPFMATIAMFVLGFLGLAISVFPNLVPPSLSIWDTAAAVESQTFMLAGTVVLLPVILGYTVFVYWVFRGKVGEHERY